MADDIDALFESCLDDMPLQSEDKDETPDILEEDIRNALKQLTPQDENVEQMVQEFQKFNQAPVNQPPQSEFIASLSKCMDEISADLGEYSAPGDPFANPMFADFARIFRDIQSDGEFGNVLDGILQDVLKPGFMAETIEVMVRELEEFLEKNRATLPAEELQNYEGMTQAYRDMLAILSKSTDGDYTPEEHTKVQELMAKAQSFGTPPQEVIEKVAPPGKSSNDSGETFLDFIKATGMNPTGDMSKEEKAELEKMADDPEMIMNMMKSLTEKDTCPQM